MPPEYFQNWLPPQYGWGRLFFRKWFRRGPLRAAHGIPSSTEGISDYFADASEELQDRKTNIDQMFTLSIPPPPGENTTKIICPEYQTVLDGVPPTGLQLLR